jgi:hypothetical protein
MTYIGNVGELVLPRTCFLLIYIVNWSSLSIVCEHYSHALLTSACEVSEDVAMV